MPCYSIHFIIVFSMFVFVLLLSLMLGGMWHGARRHTGIQIRRFERIRAHTQPSYLPYLLTKRRMLILADSFVAYKIQGTCNYTTIEVKSVAIAIAIAS